ncbi:hypothetical protein PYW07_003807 [Mythimna separata]|uniref:Uncharacterized protein n=1 Tax=Mythimna separata TaxID=271217 RepID=A0AAD7YQA9_MYTSE|nr:hypothetical protein PYW07_003807 [Mythimna separata]
MRRKEPPQAQSAGRGKSLISTRTMQQQQRKTQSTRSLLPRSYSSPAPQNDPDVMPQTVQRGYVIRSYSSPDHKQIDYRRNSDSFYRPKIHGSRSELDSDLENFEQFEECFIDIDADQDEGLITQYRSPERDEPRKVMTSMLPGSGLQRVSIRPIHSTATQTLHSAREVMKKLQKDDSKGPSRLNFRPLVVKMPARHILHTDRDPPSPGVEELQCSPQLELEAAELDRELDNAERHLDKGVAMATEESDADTVSLDM